MRERGLKHYLLPSACYPIVSLPMRERGLKQSWIHLHIAERFVAPHAGAWIETNFIVARVLHKQSLPMRERGLKHRKGFGVYRRRKVAPHAGAWIETQPRYRYAPPQNVAPHAGAWIETIVS